MRKALFILARAQKVYKVLHLSQPLRRQLPDHFNQPLFGCTHCMCSCLDLLTTALTFHQHGNLMLNEHSINTSGWRPPKPPCWWQGQIKKRMWVMTACWRAPAVAV
jgi:hypothetical protein